MLIPHLGLILKIIPVKLYSDMNVFLKVIDVSMATIYQKDENRLSMNFVQIRSVIEKLIPIF